MRETSLRISAEVSAANTSAARARRILYSLMVPAISMPLAGSMFGVALPVIRDEFAIQADTAGWVATAFSLPFMILMPVYGRLSDGLGKRRLLVFCATIFAIGAAIAAASSSLSGLILGRVVMGLGASGIIPLCLALISAIYTPDERGKALGMWSLTGPTTGMIGPVMAGFVIAAWGWRAAFLPGLIIAVLGAIIIYFNVPPRLVPVKPGFLRTFDWIGSGLLSAALVFLLFFLSSEPITGVAPLRDWRLLAGLVIFMASFVAWEQRRENPLIQLGVVRNLTFLRASSSAMLRMFIMGGGLGFLLPLYLADVYQLTSTQIGFVATWNPAAMMIMVRFGGRISDRFGSRRLVMFGFTMQMIVMGILGFLPGTTPLWLVSGVTALHGIGAGLMLASLHRAALTSVSDDDMGASSGLYSMIRFVGSVVAPALGGVLLQAFLDGNPSNVLGAYQSVYLFYGAAAIIGLFLATGLPRTKSAA